MQVAALGAYAWRQNPKVGGQFTNICQRLWVCSSHNNPHILTVIPLLSQHSHLLVQMSCLPRSYQAQVLQVPSALVRGLAQQKNAMLRRLDKRLNRVISQVGVECDGLGAQRLKS